MYVLYAYKPFRVYSSPVRVVDEHIVLMAKISRSMVYPISPINAAPLLINALYQPIFRDGHHVIYMYVINMYVIDTRP